MKREITNKINYVLDEWIPPVLRDNRFFMGVLLRLAVGKKYKVYMEFKEKLPFMKEKDINRYYTLLADTFNERETDLSDKSVDYICSIVQRGGKILDAACGKGYLARLLKSYGEITALDIVLPKKKEEEINYVQGTLTNLPFESESFDAVICTHALEHIKDPAAALAELRRVCKKQLIIVVPRQREYKYTFDLHVNFFPYRYNVEQLLVNKNAFIRLMGNDWICQENIQK